MNPQCLTVFLQKFVDVWTSEHWGENATVHDYQIRFIIFLWFSTVGFFIGTEHFELLLELNYRPWHRDACSVDGKRISNAVKRKHGDKKILLSCISISCIFVNRKST